MLLGPEQSDNFDLLEFITVWINEVESLSKNEIWTSEDKLDFVLNKVSQLISQAEYIKNERLLIIVINGLIKMANGHYMVKTNPHKNKACFCCSIS